MPLLRFPALLLATLLAGCAAQTPAPVATTAPDAPPPPVVLGADRDAHGCIASAGYRWCERLRRCERPWELAAEKGHPNTPEAFAGLCGGTPPAVVTPAAPTATPTPPAEANIPGLADTETAPAMPATGAAASAGSAEPAETPATPADALAPAVTGPIAAPPGTSATPPETPGTASAAAPVPADARR